jgi:hypothetical protein
LRVVDFPPMAAKIIGTGSGFMMNYAFRQFVVFSQTPRLPGWALSSARSKRKHIGFDNCSKNCVLEK